MLLRGWSCFCLIASPALAQAVGWRHGALKPTYLQGEPIVATVEVTNVGVDPIAVLRVRRAGGLRRARHGPACPTNTGGAASRARVVALPYVESAMPLRSRRGSAPRLLTYLLGGYSLSPGRYRARLAGRAGVRWGWEIDYSRPPLPTPPRHQPNEAVPGALFDRTFTFEIVAATPKKLEAALAPYLADAASADLQRRDWARSAIVVSAPPFLVALIARFADDPGVATGAIDALGRMNTPESRRRLRGFTRTADSRHDGRQSRSPWRGSATRTTSNFSLRSRTIQTPRTRRNGRPFSDSVTSAGIAPRASLGVFVRAETRAAVERRRRDREHALA